MKICAFALLSISLSIAIMALPNLALAKVSIGSSEKTNPSRTILAMAEKPDEDTFVLDENGTASDMEAKLAKIIERHKTPEAVDKIIRRDNPDAKITVINDYGKEKWRVYRYSISRPQIIHREVFIAHIAMVDGRIVHYGCNRGYR